jgi:hypothetical protein
MEAIPGPSRDRPRKGVGLQQLVGAACGAWSQVVAAAHCATWAPALRRVRERLMVWEVKGPRRGPVLGGPLWDILVLDLRIVDLYQDVH